MRTCRACGARPYREGRSLRIRVLASAAFLLAWGSGPAVACGAETDCVVGERSYRIHLPEGREAGTPIGAVIHAHGYRGTAAGVMRNRSLRREASRLGIALIALQSDGNDWNIPHAPRRPDSDGSVEFAYVEDVISDAARRFAIDRDRLMISGFSAGGMLAWTLACHVGGDLAVFLPIAGTFWGRVPDRCSGEPAALIHIHGTSDEVVPLEGRPIADTRQGSVHDALALFGGGDPGAPAAAPGAPDLTCEDRSAPGKAILRFCTHPGGHRFRAEWIAFAWQSFQDAGHL